MPARPTVGTLRSSDKLPGTVDLINLIESILRAVGSNWEKHSNEPSFSYIIQRRREHGGPAGPSSAVTYTARQQQQQQQQHAPSSSKAKALLSSLLRFGRH